MEEAKSDPLQKMKDFIGYDKVRKFKELLTIVDGGVFVVVAWFVSVDEGVDCWFPDVDVNVKSKLRFRMKLKVRDGEEVAIFSLFDSDVECLAMETCPLLNSMGESCSLFPDEMECFFGDAILFKVEKDHLEEDDQIAHFKVISMCNEVDVVNKFIDEYPSMDENIELLQAHSNNEGYNTKIHLAKIRGALSLTETKVELLVEACSRKRSRSVLYEEDLKQTVLKQKENGVGENI
ncbi:hypothetical protein P8452_14322 [Trifolium repens]|nr:hypothetical protein P8452_14322 [Trifolium repens]